MRLKLKVIGGKKLGRQLGFRTANFALDRVPENFQQGVYAAQVWVKGKVWPGALYFGPRTWKNPPELVFEVHILGFSGDIYGEVLELKVGKFVRAPKQCENAEELRELIASDMKKISG